MNIYEDLKKWGDCGLAAITYSVNNIQSHAQAWGWLVASDEHERLVWLALRAPAVSREQLNAFLNFMIERAIRRALPVYTEPSFVTWANKWLSGEDRTENMARAAASEALVWGATYEVRMVVVDAAWVARAVLAPTAWDARALVEDMILESNAEEIRQQAYWWRKQPNPFKE